MTPSSREGKPESSSRLRVSRTLFARAHEPSSSSSALSDSIVHRDLTELDSQEGADSSGSERFLEREENHPFPFFIHLGPRRPDQAELIILERRCRQAPCSLSLACGGVVLVDAPFGILQVMTTTC